MNLQEGRVRQAWLIQDLASTEFVSRGGSQVGDYVKLKIEDAASTLNPKPLNPKP